MAKRRTKKQKRQAKHQFLLKWEPEKPITKAKAQKTVSVPTVKGQIKNQAGLSIKTKTKVKFADFQANNEALVLIKRDLVKSLIIASLILALEVVLYLAWK